VLDLGGHLCLEIVARAAGSRPLPDDWLVDGEWFSRGAQTSDVGSSCSGNGQALIAWVDGARLSPGHTASFYGRGNPGQLGFHALGFSDQFFNGVPLPFDLGPLGAPGCKVYSDWVILSAHVTDPLASRWFGDTRWHLQLPLDQNLLGARLFSQWFFLDGTANALGLTATHGVQCRMELALPSEGIGTVMSDDPDAPNGRVLTHRAPVLQFAGW
jgi:hypothetical protein